MTDTLATYSDWAWFIDQAGSNCTPAVTETLAAGSFEPHSAGRVYQLICEYCVRCLDALDEALFTQLRTLAPQDSYGVFLLCSRYCNACERLLFFRRTEGLPVDWKDDLEQDIRQNMSGALSYATRMTPAAATDDGRYYLHCLKERRCTTR